ncbi:hypothetical protein LKMCDIF_00008 [Enterococcus phage vB_OCPT_CCS4]|nr:hypothetical protein LKMCDIF_00008 [Enterococcus phage vB_OCPT_CCS4]
MKYTENDIKVGTKMTCIDNNDTPWWTNGKIYEVKKKVNYQQVVFALLMTRIQKGI